jgi:hypothetical protein
MAMHGLSNKKRKFIFAAKILNGPIKHTCDHSYAQNYARLDQAKV